MKMVEIISPRIEVIEKKKVIDVFNPKTEKRIKHKKVKYTSIISYIANFDKIGKRYEEIILIFKKFKSPMNNQMVLREMRKDYPNIEISSITGRTNELRKKETEGRAFPVLILSHTALCPITGEQTEFYKLNQGIRDFLA